MDYIYGDNFADDYQVISPLSHLHLRRATAPRHQATVRETIFHKLPGLLLDTQKRNSWKVLRSFFKQYENCKKYTGIPLSLKALSVIMIWNINQKHSCFSLWTPLFLWHFLNAGLLKMKHTECNIQAKQTSDPFVPNITSN